VSTRRYKIQSDKTLRAESKDDLKKRIGRSPDDADAPVLAFAGSGSWEVLDTNKITP
jgi:phage terminase large subunit